LETNSGVIVPCLCSLYRELNNGVYHASFATTQQAYEEAFCDVSWWPMSWRGVSMTGRFYLAIV